MFWRILNGIDGLIPGWVTDHCIWDWLGIELKFPTPPEMFALFFGYEPECFGVQMALKWKMIQVWLMVFGWIAWIFLVIIRFIELLVFWILYWVIWIMQIIINFIIEILWPVIAFFIWLYLMIVWIIKIPIYWIWFVLMIIWNFFLSIYLIILCFFIWLHDFLWSIFWYVVNFIFELVWPIIYWIIQVLWFIPMWLLMVWYYVWNIIWSFFDQICVDIFTWIELNILDPLLEALPAPTWQPAFGPEFGLAMPIVMYHFITDNLDALKNM